MAALTLAESAKLETGDMLRQGVIEAYSGSSDVLANLAFESIPGGSLTYLSEEAYPGVGFRGVNEAYTATTGVLNPKTETLTIAGGDLDVDKFIIATRGEQQRAVQIDLKTRALGLAWTQKFIKGDNQSDPREFDGLQTRLTGDQKFQAGTTANGTALSLGVMDEAIRRTLFPTAILMSSKMKNKFRAASRTTAVGGYISFDKNEMGAEVMSYGGLPILTVDLDGTGSEILGFDEAATSGTATGSSIYIMNMGNDGVQGIQNGSIMTTDLGELDTAPVFRTRVEWYSGLAVFNGKAATRIWSIADSAITA
jgi:hypothetical protein